MLARGITCTGAEVSPAKFFPLRPFWMGAVLIDRMGVVPTAEDVERVGDLIEAGEHSDEDLAFVRAVPSTLLRMASIERHYPVFVDYRLWEY